MPPDSWNAQDADSLLLLSRGQASWLCLSLCPESAALLPTGSVPAPAFSLCAARLGHVSVLEGRAKACCGCSCCSWAPVVLGNGRAEASPPAPSRPHSPSLGRARGPSCGLWSQQSVRIRRVRADSRPWTPASVGSHPGELTRTCSAAWRRGEGCTWASGLAPVSWEGLWQEVPVKSCSQQRSDAVLLAAAALVAV